MPIYNTKDREELEELKKAYKTLEQNLEIKTTFGSITLEKDPILENYIIVYPAEKDAEIIRITKKKKESIITKRTYRNFSKYSLENKNYCIWPKNPKAKQTNPY